MQGAFHKNAQYAHCLCEKGSTPFAHKYSPCDATSLLDRHTTDRVIVGGERERGASERIQ
jgi:hypothetical protein